MNAMNQTILILALFLSTALAQHKGIAVSIERFGNFVNPLQIHLFQLENEFLIHKACPEVLSIKELDKLQEKELEKGCDVLTPIPLKYVLKELLKSKFKELVNVTEKDIKDLDENTLIQKLQNNIKEENALFWNLLERETIQEEFETTSYFKAYGRYNSQLNNFLVNMSWLYTRLQDKKEANLNYLRKIRYETLGRLRPIFSESKTTKDQWLAIIYNPLDINEDQKILNPLKKDIEPIFSCSVVFGENWKEPSLERMKENYEGLLETDLFYYLEDKNIWLTDTNNKQEKAIYLMKKPTLITNHRNRRQFVDENESAYMICYCENQKKQSCNL